MADKKLTDEEIIKALEYCLADRIECDKCALQRECESNPFYSAIAKYALDLIKRQKAEIKKLKECPKCVYEYDGETMEYCVRRKSDDKLFQFYAGTGKIMGFENKRGIHSFWLCECKKVRVLENG